MSHLTRIETEISDMECLEKALKDLGHSIQKGGEISYHGDKEKVEIKAGGIGFKKQKDGKYQIIKEWGSSGDREVNKIKQRYAFHKTIKEVNKSRKFSVRHRTLDNGSIELDLTSL